MSGTKDDRLGESGEFQLLKELGQLVRDKRTRGVEDEPAYEPLSAEARSAIARRVFGKKEENEEEDDDDDARPGSHSVASPVEVEAPAASGERRRLANVVGYIGTAAAAAAVTVLAVGLPKSGSSEPEAPPFGSWRIDGGGPRPAHQGATEPRTTTTICKGRTLALSVAAKRDHTVDRSLPLELVLDATPATGAAHRVLYRVADDPRFLWSDDGQALIYEGTLEQLVPLSLGSWSLQLSAGALGTCGRADGHPACTVMQPRPIEVVAEDRCDASR